MKNSWYSNFWYEKMIVAQLFSSSLRFRTNHSYLQLFWYAIDLQSIRTCCCLYHFHIFHFDHLQFGNRVLLVYSHLYSCVHWPHFFPVKRSDRELKTRRTQHFPCTRKLFLFRLVGMLWSKDRAEAIALLRIFPSSSIVAVACGGDFSGNATWLRGQIQAKPPDLLVNNQ